MISEQQLNLLNVCDRLAQHNFEIIKCNYFSIYNNGIIANYRAVLHHCKICRFNKITEVENQVWSQDSRINQVYGEMVHELRLDSYCSIKILTPCYCTNFKQPENSHYLNHIGLTASEYQEYVDCDTMTLRVVALQLSLDLLLLLEDFLPIELELLDLNQFLQGETTIHD